ncbi:MAG: dienelactone hydrolase family protein [Hyphomicrobiales bacterium]
MISAFRMLLTVALVVSGGLPLAAAPEAVEFQGRAKYHKKTVTLSGELFRPEGAGPFPAVVLMHGCAGLSPPVHDGLRAHAEYLTQHGFVALILDSFGPRKNAGGWVCKTYGRLGAARRYRTTDALDAGRFLQAQDFVDADNIFQVGQSNGGSVSIRLAQFVEPVFRAIAAYYPWCGAFNGLGNNATLTSPLIVFGGEADDWVPPQKCKTVVASGTDYKVIVYPDAAHSFDLNIKLQKYQGHLVGYNRPATLDSRRQMVAFFRKHFTAALKSRAPAQ